MAKSETKEWSSSLSAVVVADPDMLFSVDRRRQTDEFGVVVRELPSTVLREYDVIDDSFSSAAIETRCSKDERFCSAAKGWLDFFRVNTVGLLDEESCSDIATSKTDFKMVARLRIAVSSSRGISEGSSARYSDVSSSSRSSRDFSCSSSKRSGVLSLPSGVCVSLLARVRTCFFSATW